MKDQTNKVIHLLLIFAFIGSAVVATSQTNYDLQDVEYQGRYVDLVNGKFYDAPFTVTVNVHESMPSILHVTASDLQGMVDIWNSVGSFLEFELVDGGTGDIVKAEFPNNQQFNVIGADDPDPALAKTFQFVYNPADKETSHLAWCKNWMPEVDCSNWWHPIIFGGDIIINSQPKANVHILTPEEQGDKKKQNIDLLRIVLHELGHLAGIRHHPDATTDDIMYETQGPGDYLTILSQLDKYALKRLYGINPADPDGKPYDVGMLSSIPCALFETTDIEKLLSIPPEPSDDPPPPPPPSDCPPESLGMTINGQSMEWDGVEWYYPCISVPISLHATGNCLTPKWSFPSITESDFCANVSQPLLCSLVNLFVDCECRFYWHKVEIFEVCGNSNSPCGQIYTKEYKVQIDFNETESELISSIIIDQSTLNEMGISLLPGKIYLIQIAGLGTGYYTQKFRIAPSDVNLSYKNLLEPELFFDLSDWEMPGNFPASFIGRNVTLHHITTNSPITADNPNGTNNIRIEATKSISISNSVITPRFEASIVDVACASSRQGNPDSNAANPETGKNFNERIVHYNSKPAQVVNNNQETAYEKIEDVDLSKKINAGPSIFVPNPSYNGKFTLSSPIPEFANYEIAVFNLLGEKIYQSRILLKDYVIDLSAQPKGTYFVQISNIDELTVQKIVYQ